MTEQPDNKVSLKEFLEAILKERDKSLMERMEALNVRLEHLNELRTEVTRDRSMFVIGQVFERVIDGLNTKIIQLEKTASSNAGMIKILLPLTSIFGGLVGAVVAHLIK